MSPFVFAGIRKLVSKLTAHHPGGLGILDLADHHHLALIPGPAVCSRRRGLFVREGAVAFRLPQGDQERDCYWSPDDALEE